MKIILLIMAVILMIACTTPDQPVENTIYALCENAPYVSEQWTCVTECPQNYDSYMTQIGTEVCIEHVSEQVIETWPTCTKSTNDCNCVKAYETTNNMQIENAQFRCVPDQYAERFLFRGGQEFKDENGEVAIIIA